MMPLAIQPWKSAAGLGVVFAVLASSPVTTKAEPQIGPLPKIAKRAEEGRFDTVLASLKADVDLADDPRVASLVHDLERHQDSLQEHRVEHRAAYHEALVQIEAGVLDDKLHEALVRALEAHDLAEDVEVMRQDHRIGELVTRAEQAAAEAEQDGDWIEATGLYRALDLLYDNSSTRYHESLKRTLQHVRIMRFYDPRRAHELAAARALRDNPDDDIKPYKPRDETWEQRVEGATLSMFKKVLTYAADRHVDVHRFRSLLLGSLDALLILAHDTELDRVFPSFGNPKKVNTFRQFLLSKKQQLHERGDQLMGSRDVNIVINDIFRANKRTVGLPKAVLAYELTEGAMAGLDDFTAVIWPYDQQNFSRSTSGKFIGIGVQISLRDKRLIVVSPLPGTPAYRARMLPGDIIVRVDGKATESWTLDRAVRAITGESGTTVVLTIERKGYSEPFDISIKRAQIEIESVRGWQILPNSGGKWNYWIDKEYGIAYVRLSQFIPQTADGLDDALDSLRGQRPLNALILDLRFNPGGLLKSAIEVADKFIDHGLIVSTVDATATTIGPTYRGRRDRTRPRLPLAVLINQHAASASEIVAGAIQDYNRGTIVGVRSFGKGSVQDLFPLANGRAYLKLTTQYYRLPLKRIIHRKPMAKTWGIEPDVELKMTEKQVRKMVEFRRDADVIRDEAHTPGVDDTPAPMAAELLSRSLDPQLDAALLVLKTQLVCDHLTREAKREDRKERGFSVGTGFLVTHDGLLITNYHVIDEAKEIQVVREGRVDAKARVIRVDAANDIALLKTNIVGKPLPFVESKTLRKGDEILTIGYPLIRLQGQESKATFGRVNAMSGIKGDVRFIQVDLPIQPGNSGGPLVTRRGEVVGVISATLDQQVALRESGSLPQNVNYAVKSEYVMSLLRTVGVKGQQRPDGKGLRNVPDVVAAVDSSVFLVIAK